jgi:hypothetical protein
MDAGYAKEKAQQENNFEKRLTSLDSEKATILKKEQENIDAIFRNMNPNSSKTKTVAPAVTNLGDISTGYSSLLKQSTAGGMTQTTALINTSLKIANEALASYNSEVDSAQKDNDAKLSVLLEKQLLEYGDYTAKKAKIEEDYNKTLIALAVDRATYAAKGDTDMVGRIDSSRIQSETNKAKDLMALSFGQLKSTPEFAMAFEDLGNVSTSTIEKLMIELNKFKQTAAGTMPLADFKAYANEIGKITDEFIKRNPFKALKESAEDLKNAQKDVASAKIEVGLASVGLSQTVGLGGVNAPRNADGTTNQGIGIGGLTTISGTEKTNALTTANNKLAASENNVKTATNNGQKALKTITDSYGELSKELSSVGSAIGGTAGEIISAIGDIGSFVTSAITGWQAASNGATGALLVVEKASVILAVISSVITVATKIVAMFTSASKKRAEEAQAEVDSILAVKKAWLDAYATMTNKKFSNIFGDDVFGKATAQAELMGDAAKTYNDNRAALLDTQSKLQAKVDGYKKQIADGVKNVYLPTLLRDAEASLATFNSTWGNITSTTIDGFDEVAAKAQIAATGVNALSDENKKLLQSQIDAYDAYQTYLSEIDSYLSGIFGQLGGNLMDALVTDQDNLTQWTDDVTGYISDSFAKMVKDIIYNMEFAEPLAKAQAAIQAIMANKDGLYDSQAAKEAAIQAALVTLKSDLATNGPIAQDLLNAFETGAAAAGFDISGTAGDTTNSTTSAFKGMDQPTADILTAQFSAMRIHTSNMDTTLSRYLPELSLSLQSQAGILQLAFADVSQIRQNTNRIPEMVDILKDLKTYGIKVL